MIITPKLYNQNLMKNKMKIQIKPSMIMNNHQTIKNIKAWKKPSFKTRAKIIVKTRTKNKNQNLKIYNS